MNQRLSLGHIRNAMPVVMRARGCYAGVDHDLLLLLSTTVVPSCVMFRLFPSPCRRRYVQFSPWLEHIQDAFALIQGDQPHHDGGAGTRNRRDGLIRTRIRTGIYIYVCVGRSSNYYVYAHISGCGVLLTHLFADLRYLILGLGRTNDQPCHTQPSC